MSILIKGMEMPTRCEDCFCYRHNAEYDYAYCNISSVNVRGHGNARLVSCPLIPAADVRPVVLCRDCLHYEMGVCLKIYDDGAANKDAWQERKPDDFCSYGEDRNVPTNYRTDMRPTSMSGAKGET